MSYHLLLCPYKVCKYCYINFSDEKAGPKIIYLIFKKIALELKCLLTPNSVLSNIFSFKILLGHCRNGFKIRRMYEIESYRIANVQLFLSSNDDSFTSLTSQVKLAD